MNRKQIYVALCAIALGKSIINPGEQLPADVSEGKIQALLANGSIESSANSVDNAADLKEAARVEALIKRATELGIDRPEEIKANALETMVADAEKKAAEFKPSVDGDGSGQALPDASSTEKVADGVSGEMTATLSGVVTKDGRVVELSALSAAALKKLAADLGVAGAASMKKNALVEAITAVEFAADK